MNVVLTIVFFVCAALAVAGALGGALAPAATWRLLALLAVAVGAAGVLLSFAEGFAALVTLVCLGASALLIGGEGAPRPSIRRPAPAGVAFASLSSQLGAIVAVLLLAVLLVIALTGSFATGAAAQGPFDAAAIGRALFDRDALPLEAVGVGLLTALAVGAVGRSRRP